MSPRVTRTCAHITRARESHNHITSLPIPLMWLNFRGYVGGYEQVMT
jgi:hypothetical protein